MPMTEANKKLHLVRAEIEAVLKKHDVAAFVSLHSPDAGEVFWNIWPGYSVLKGDFPTIRIRSVEADYGDDKAKFHFDRQQTAQMIHHLGMSTGQVAPQFLELAQILNEKFGASHTDEFMPRPSSMNSGSH